MPASPSSAPEQSRGLALALSTDRVMYEVTQQLRRALSCEAVALALSSSGDGRDLRISHAVGFDGNAESVEGRLSPVWREVMADGSARALRAPSGNEITAPIGDRGAVTVLTAGIDDPASLQEAVRAVTAVAQLADVALERVTASTRLIERHRLKSMQDVSAGIGNELRSPVSAIMSAAQLLRYSMGEDPVLERNVGRILREAERLSQLVVAMLDYGRPMPMRSKVGDPDRVWASVLLAHRGALESRALLAHYASAGPSVACTLDPDQLAEAFGHILINAIEAAPEGTDLNIDVRVIIATTTAEWVCQVRDQGPSVALETVVQAFDPFFSTKSGHTGIGLAIARRIITGHGGSIELGESASTGTMVTIRLPVLTD